MRNFRMAAGVVLTSVALILGYLILRVRVEKIGIWMAIDLIVLIIGTMSFFASIHPSTAEGIQTSFLVECYLSSGYDYMQKCIPVSYYLFSHFAENYKPWRRRVKTDTGTDPHILNYLLLRKF